MNTYGLIMIPYHVNLYKDSHIVKKATDNFSTVPVAVLFVIKVIM